MDAYSMVLKSIDPGSDAKVDVSGAQQALAALQEKALVWKAARGVYALEETGLIALMDQAGMLAAVPVA
ncbi:hypothetical protein [Cupriavidus necator]